MPVSPFITDLPDLVCKNKNIEGGMGIHFFKNAAFGGDWILQEKMVNMLRLSIKTVMFQIHAFFPFFYFIDTTLIADLLIN